MRPLARSFATRFYDSPLYKNLKSEYENNEKVLKKAEKWLEKFDVKKFMKNYPTITCSDFYIIMYMETESIRP